MNIATLREVTYHYPRARVPALHSVTLGVEEGEFCVLAGESGGGKSTLLRVFNGLIPQFHGGTISGSVEVAGMDPGVTAPRRMAGAVGMVFQEPESQAIAETVLEEVAFGLEQAAVPRAEMQRRVDAVLAALAIEHLRHRRLRTLSGGERQRVAIAAVLALEPALLVLDEPTSQLDGAGANAVLAAIDGVCRDGRLTVLIAEHRLDRLLPAVDRVIHVSRAEATALTPAQAALELSSVPPAAALARRRSGRPALTVAEARGMLPAGLRVSPRPSVPTGEVLLAAESVTATYGEHVALRDVSFTLREGELTALIGPNGSGKSTLFRALTGLTPPAAGRVAFPALRGVPRSVREVTAFAGLVPQDPALTFYRESVEDEVGESLRLRGGRRDISKVATALERWGIEDFAKRNPRDVSVGQQQRVALATMLAHEPRVWLLDEPTRGADGRAKDELAARLRAHAAAGGAAVVATHDIETAARFASRVITLEAGGVLSDLPARSAFAAGGPHPTQVAQLVPGAITVEEVAHGPA